MSSQVHHIQYLKRIFVWVAIDCTIIIASYILAFSVRAITTPLDLVSSFSFILIACIITVVINYLFRIYHRLWARSSGHEVGRIVSAVAVSMILVAVLDFPFGSSRPLPLSVVLLGNTFALVVMVAVRYRSRLIMGLRWRWRAVWYHEFPTITRVLIVGAGEAGENLAWRLKYRWQKPHDNQRFQVVGFVDDDPQKQDLYIEGCRVLGTREDIPALVEQHQINLIVLALHNISGPDFREVVALCERTQARIKVMPDAYASINSTHDVSLLRDVQAEDILGRKLIERYEGVDFGPVTNKVVLVTGAAGSIGSEICRQILAFDPIKLILLDNNESGLYDLVTEIHQDRPEATVVPCLADITDREALGDIFSHHAPHIVFHAAAYKHVPMLELYPYQAVRVNIGGTWYVAEEARRHDVERFVLISTDKAVDPTSIMGASKRLCELLVHALATQNVGKTQFTAVRFGNVLGSRGSVVPLFNRQIDNGGPVTVTHPEMTRYFMTIPEAVNLVIHAACMTDGHDLFMLRMGEVVRILDLAERMIRMRGLLPYEDIPIVFTGIRPGEKLHEELQHSSETVTPSLHPHIVHLKSKKKYRSPDDLLADLHNLLTCYGPGCEDLAQKSRALAGDPASMKAEYMDHMMGLIRHAHSPNGQNGHSTEASYMDISAS